MSRRRGPCAARQVPPDGPHPPGEPLETKRTQRPGPKNHRGTKGKRGRQDDRRLHASYLFRAEWTTTIKSMSQPAAVGGAQNGPRNQCPWARPGPHPTVHQYHRPFLPWSGKEHQKPILPWPGKYHQKKTTAPQCPKTKGKPTNQGTPMPTKPSRSHGKKQTQFEPDGVWAKP